MLTLDSALLVITASYVIATGSYILYYGSSIHRALLDKLLKARVVWTLTLVFLVILQGALNLPEAFGLSTRPFRFLVASALIALSYAVGDSTIKVARIYDFARERHRKWERLVWRLSPIVWPWLVSIWLIVPLLNIVVVHPLLTVLSSLLLFVGSIFLWPIMIAGLFSARRWVADSRLKENMKWYAYLVLSIAAILWVGLASIAVLGLRGGMVGIIASLLYVLVIYTSYKSTKSLVTTHKLPEEFKAI